MMTTAQTSPIDLPRPRGALTQWLLARLQGDASSGAWPAATTAAAFGDDLQLALYLCYESHYGALPGNVGDWEWNPELIAYRQELEAAFTQALFAEVGTIESDCDVRTAIPDTIESDRGPSLSRHMESHGTLEQMRTFLVHRSAYQLKEADPHTFAIPRVDGRAKQLLAAIQAGEYGTDAPGRLMHSELFAQTMCELGLDPRRHAYLDEMSASAFLISNLISMFGLNRKWRGALVGQLAVFEMTSVVPMGRYSRGLARMRAPAAARRFYDVHVLADAEHELMALEMAGALADAEPELVPDILFGARACLVAERMFAEDLLARWGALLRTDAAA